MSVYKQCPNGHYYDTDEFDNCPFCTEHNKGVRIEEGTVWSPISDNANDLRKQTNVVLKFDSAPDGINRYVEIKRKNKELYTQSSVAGMLSCKEESIPAEIIEKIHAIDNAVGKELLKKNIYPINTPDGALIGDYYVSEKTIGSIVPETLLTQILGKGSKLDVLYRDNNRGVAVSSMALNTAACGSFGDEGFQDARKEIESKKYLSISLNDNSKKVLCIPDRKDDFCIKNIENFISEDISIFWPKIIVKEYKKQDKEYDFGAGEYASCLADIANSSGKTLYFKVSRQRVASVLLTLVAKLSELHKGGLVHCDLKPQNILCLKDGLVPFDAINVKKGEISAGMTTNYCAPEQILTMPVSPATDVYNMGLMVLSIIDGIVYGKTSTYVIPTGGTDVKEVKLLTEPMIYIDYASSNIENKEGIVFWKSFLEKCLAFEPRNRFPNMESFANEYKRILELYPLKNDIEFTPDFGRLSLVGQNGVFNASWFIKAE